LPECFNLRQSFVAKQVEFVQARDSLQLSVAAVRGQDLRRKLMTPALQRFEGPKVER